MTRFIIWSIRGYQHLISRFMPPVCRFEPSCSRYAVKALNRHGFFHGIGLSTWRILRCNPLCTGGIDPVPERLHCAK